MIEGFYARLREAVPGFCERHPLEEFVHFYYILCSRFFGVREYDSHAAFLVPYADLINTNGFHTQNATWDYDPFEKRFRIVATRAIKANEPVCDLPRERE